MNPLAEEDVEEMIEALELEPGAHVLDLGCGKAEILLRIVERYPDLKANQNFQDLQNQLEGTENRINVARQRYNHAVQIYNTSLRIFPNNLTNRFLLHLQAKQPYTAEPGAAKAPQVKF